MKRKVCVVTGTRAEYGLLYWLIKGIQEDSELELQLIVTGMHLSPEFGLTYKEIEKDFVINKKIEMILSSDTPVGISKSMGLAQISFSEAYAELNPNLVLVLGDRYEIFSAASSAMISNIPIAHLHGGETTEGAFDESIRHCITKMSHIHFAATEEYKNRIIQLGENPSRVFNIGALGIENIKKLNLLSKKEFEASILFKLNKKNILVTFHPVTLENNSTEKQFNEILMALDSLTETNIIFTKANSDTNGRIINKMINKYVNNHLDKAIVFASLGQLRYLSALQYIDIVIGNSSSGLIEVPSFKKVSINIGDRQKGRIKAKSVIDCRPIKNDILEAIKISLKKNFQLELKNVKNPYDRGNSSNKIINVLKQINLDNLLQKSFYDLDKEVE